MKEDGGREMTVEEDERTCERGTRKEERKKVGKKESMKGNERTCKRGRKKEG